MLSDHWSLDASFGYSWIENDQFRTAPGTTTRITSSPDSNRWFFSANLNGITSYENWVLGARAGYLLARNETEGFIESDATAVTERNSELGQWRIGGDVAYGFKNFEPYVGLLYAWDYAFEELTFTTGRQPANDRDDLLLTAGLRYFGNANISGNFEYSKRLLREDFDEESLNIVFRYDF